MTKKKVLAVASIGGHWIQLLRVSRELEKDYEVIYCSTHNNCASMVPGNDFYTISDFNRKNAWRLFPSFFRHLCFLRKIRPDAVVTTGAAPGLVMLLAARIYGIKTIWIDSIANVESLSWSGRIAKKLASRIYTQWPALAHGKVIYKGNVLGSGS